MSYLSSSLKRQTRNAHRLLASIIILALLLWLVSAGYFNLIEPLPDVDYPKVETSGQSLATNNAVQDMDSERFKLLMANNPGVIEIEFHPFPEKVSIEPLLRLNSADASWLASANTLQPIAVDESLATSILTAKYDLAEDTLSPTYIAATEDLPEYQGKLWQLALGDEVDSRFYVDEKSGRLFGPFNDYTRTKALFLRIHFSDYVGAIGFNHWWNILLALVYLLLSFTGVYYLLTLFRQKIARRRG
ncbi:hypothetical protein [Thalassotalea sp. PS06]|uniref:hypothetical protein n=1 Tax=Thalassotalea sp. PS06 TaxID=2594005 RepID=UPI0011647C30|nr:hypothetical protein [Thalassotalea sp. PS06]QDP00581.1 hypothetical protein FNC98_03960 [Thalassotalea sp. PS06]